MPAPRSEPPAAHTETVDPPGPPGAGEPFASGDVLGRRFVLGRCLGRGASGAVFAATDLRLGQEVAVKVLHRELMTPTVLQRVRREVRLARNGHHALVRVYDLHESDGTAVVSMERIRGESLRDRLRDGRRLKVGETVDIGWRVATALSHLHGRGVVHRDVKPGNIMLASAGGAKLCDLGLARPVEHGATVTDGGGVLGTPDYMAPEQARRAELSPAADVYALGLTLYRALTGDVPLREDSAISTLMRRQRERPPNIRRIAPEVPRWLERLVSWMLEPDPGRRPEAAAVVAALEARRSPLRLPWRRIAAVVLAATAIPVAPIAYRNLRAADTVRIETGRDEVRGRDARGRLTWRREFAGPVQTAEADLDGDGFDEIVAGAQAARFQARLADRPPSEVVILRRDGTEVSRLVAEEWIGRWAYPHAVALKPVLHLLDVDGDRLPDVVAEMRHLNYYPTLLFVYLPAADRWHRLLASPGHLQALAAVAGSEPPALRFVAVNNLAGLLMAAGELRVKAVNGDEPVAPQGMGVSAATAEWYTLLPLQLGQLDVREIRPLPAGGSEVRLGASTFVLDRWGNPADGPNAGCDLGLERLQFLKGLDDLAHYRPSSTGAIEGKVDELEARFGPLLDEPAYRALFRLQVGRVLARADAPRRAVARLEHALEQTPFPFDDLGLYLGNVQAAMGELDAARSTLLALVENPRTVHSSFDALLALHRVLIAQRDEEALYRQLRPPKASVEADGFARVVLARAHLWWDRVTDSDLEVRSVARAPDGDAVACLARWRAGSITLDDIAAAQQAIETNPDAADEGKLALAAARLGLDRPADALAVLDPLIAVLTPIAGDDLATTQNMALARALRARALLDTGSIDSALAEARRLAPELDPGLLPGIIVGEVIAEAEGVPRG